MSFTSFSLIKIKHGDTEARRGKQLKDIIGNKHKKQTKARNKENENTKEPFFW